MNERKAANEQKEAKGPCSSATMLYCLWLQRLVQRMANSTNSSRFPAAATSDTDLQTFICIYLSSNIYLHILIFKRSSQYIYLHHLSSYIYLHILLSKHLSPYNISPYIYLHIQHTTMTSIFMRYSLLLFTLACAQLLSTLIILPPSHSMLYTSLVLRCIATGARGFQHPSAPRPRTFAALIEPEKYASSRPPNLGCGHPPFV